MVTRTVRSIINALGNESVTSTPIIRANWLNDGYTVRHTLEGRPSHIPAHREVDNKGNTITMDWTGQVTYNDGSTGTDWGRSDGPAHIEQNGNLLWEPLHATVTVRVKAHRFTD